MSLAYIRGGISSKGVFIEEIVIPMNIWDGLFHRAGDRAPHFCFRAGLDEDQTRYDQVAGLLHAINVMVNEDPYLRSLRELNIPVPYYLDESYELLEHIYSFTERKRPPKQVAVEYLFSRN